MIRVTWDQGFKRIYKKKVKNNQELKKRFWDAMEIFLKEPLNPRLRTHKLSGKLEGFWAFSVTYDHRVIFKFLDKDKILLVDIGGHDEVY